MAATGLPAIDFRKMISQRALSGAQPMKKQNRWADRRGADKASPGTIAKWMLNELKSAETLYQSEVADRLYEEYGLRFVYENDRGNLAINRDVLAEFRTLTETTVVWDRSERAWRWRDEYDGSGRSAEA
jgi:hypothetical protein